MSWCIRRLHIDRQRKYRKTHLDPSAMKIYPLLVDFLQHASMNRQTSVLNTAGVVLFTPLAFLWQLLNQFLLSPWGLIVPMTLLIAFFAIQELQKIPAQTALFYAEQLETASESELSRLLETLVRMGDVGVPGLVQGLTSQRESVFTASLNVLQREFDRWQESDQREHHFRIFSEALLRASDQFSPVAQAEAIRFVDQMMQIRTAAVISPEASADRQQMIAYCGQILSQLESMRRRRIEPQHPDFEPPTNTVAALDQRTRQPVLLASNGQPFVPTSARKNKEDESLLADAGSFHSYSVANLSVARGDRLLAYQRSLQNRQTENRSDLSSDGELSDMASFSVPLSFPADIEGRVAQNFSENDTKQPADISEEYRNRKQSESEGTFGSDTFITPELLNTPLNRVQNLPTTQLMQLLHHTEPSYVESARKTLMSRDGFQEPHLKLAWRLYHPIPAVRQEIVAMLPNTPNVQPAVWLTVLLNDPSNDVRYRTASFLATTRDPALQRLLIDRGKRDGDARITSLATRLDESQRGTVRR